MLRREILAVAALSVLPGAVLPSVASAQDSVKIGLILPMTGQQASTGKQIDAAVKLYQAQKGTTVAGKKIEVILKDDTSVPDVTKRLAQELVVNDKVAVLAGFGITPSAMATAPIASQAKVPEVVMAAGTSSITEASPFVVRTSFTLAQSSVPMAGRLSAGPSSGWGEVAGLDMAARGIRSWNVAAMASAERRSEEDNMASKARGWGLERRHVAGGRACRANVARGG